MVRYVARRAGQAVVVLLGVSVIVFTLIHLVPGDPVRSAMGTRFDQATYDALRSRAGLDEPLVQQYFTYLGHALTGDLGVSFRSGEPVTSLLLQRLPATASLAITALLIALLIALPLGVLAGMRAGSAWDYGATGVSQVGVSVPDFWTGILLILVFASTFGLLPPSGYEPLFGDPLGWASHVVLPALAVGVVSGAILTRFVRGAVLESLRRDYTRTARSKGLRESTIVRRHVLRGALVPIVTVTGLQLAGLLGGVIVIEIVFAWPGLGQLTIESVQNRDYPMVQGAVLLLAAIFLVVNLLVDLLYAVLDPRIRYS
ncbi:ABC transporter permease [Spongisporangium articulatum]|uniref:ABC transporter permease n=1 Tax=Spongisporangium articulatum TaxID=3362603 RepID=A0ABW8AI91_9ACTN